MNKHQTLTAWAADCAERVLFVFEEASPFDKRPREAVAAARSWIRGELKMTEARKFAFAAHAAAREVIDIQAIAAATSAGHAAATTHVPAHAKYAASYALKAVKDIEDEKEWQQKYFPSGC